MNEKPVDLLTFAHIVNSDPNNIPASVQSLLAQKKLSYHQLEEDESEQVRNNILERLQLNSWAVSGAHRLPDWERGWTENLRAFQARGCQPEVLIPRYLHPHQVDRFNGGYIRSSIPYFHVLFCDVFRQYLFLSFMAQAPVIYEFGCGTGYNLLTLANLFPHQKTVGLDWSQVSIQLVQEIAQSGYPGIEGRYFDMFHPDPGFQLMPQSVVFTFNSMEQLGTEFKAFIHYLLEQQVALCMHVEPLVELYNPLEPFDQLAIRYHHQRGYLNGFVPFMQQLAEQRAIELLKLQHIPLGGQFHDGYSLLIWKPL